MSSVYLSDRMSFAASALFEQVTDMVTAHRLADLCRAQGIEAAIGLAMIDAEMAAQLLEGEEAFLMAPLLEAVERARPLIPGWKATVSGIGGRGGGGSSGGPVPDQSPPPAGPPPGEPLARLGVLAPRPGSSQGAVSTSAAALRASRLLRVFTRGMLAGRTKPPVAPPPHVIGGEGEGPGGTGQGPNTRRDRAPLPHL